MIIRVGGLLSAAAAVKGLRRLSLLEHVLLISTILDKVLPRSSWCTRATMQYETAAGRGICAAMGAGV